MEEEVDLRQYLAVISKHRWVIAVLVLSAAVAAYVASSLMTPVYQANTAILIKNDQSLANPFVDALTGGMGKTEVADSIEMLKSRSLLYAVARRHNLVTSITSPEMEAVRNSVTVQPVTGSNVIRIAVEDTDPRRARDLANDLVRAFIVENQMENTKEARGARDFVAQQIRVVSEELARAEEALRRYKEKNKVFAPDEEVKAALDQVAKLEAMRAEAAISRSEAETRLAQVNRQLARQKQTVISATTIAANPLIQELKGKLAELEVELAGAREKYTDKHPLVVSLRSQIEEVKSQMKQAAERVVSTETETANPVYQELFLEASRLQVECLASGVRQETLTRLIAGQEKFFAQLPEKELELANLTRNAKVTEETYLMLKQKYEELRITEAMKSGNVRVIDEAVTPVKPVRPRKTLNVAIAAFLALFVGVGWAFLSEYLNTTLKTAEDLEKALGLPVLGQIPSYLPEHLKQARKGYGY